MNAKLIRQLFLLCLSIGITILLEGCRPSEREVAKFLYKIPLGSNRNEIRKALIEAYGKKYPNYTNDYRLADPPKLVTEAMLNSDKELISLCRREHRYCRVYPTDLYEKMPPGALFESVGIVAETSDGNGSMTIFYDNRTNYLGFEADSSGNDH